MSFSFMFIHVILKLNLLNIFIATAKPTVYYFRDSGNADTNWHHNLKIYTFEFRRELVLLGRKSHGLKELASPFFIHTNSIKS